MTTVLWFTGICCSGKTTLSKEVAKNLGNSCALFDGDEIRKTISSDLKHGKVDRKTNLDRIIGVMKKSLETVPIAIAAVVSPDKTLRAYARESFENSGHRFVEVYVKAAVDTCKARDVKGLYKKAEEKDSSVLLPGYNDHYDIPESPDIICETDKEYLDECVNKVMTFLTTHESII